MTADAIEASEFPQLVQKYGVSGVPKTIMNEKYSFVGALPEEAFADHAVEASKEGAKMT